MPTTKVKSAVKPSNKAKSAAKPKRSVKAKDTISALTVGDSLPSLELPATGGESVNLKDLKGKIVVLFFYPRDATPGCTQEAHEFSDLLPKFKKAGAQVYGISRDSLKSHERFKKKENYTVDLLSDAPEAACGLFGVMKDKNMYGKAVRGIERSTFVFDRTGKLMKEWRKVKVDGHAAEVLEYVGKLAKENP